MLWRWCCWSRAVSPRRTSRGFTQVDRSDELLDAMNRARAGACLILDGNGGLAGIFTHGDFARGFRIDPLLGGKPVASLMTRHPITVRADALAVEVLRTIGKNRIDDIVVMDADEKPVGLIDTQDLARLKIV
jgi:arabinose-5-phosphate isomerase